MDNQELKIAISLSGGGARATVFHLGILLRLAKDNLLENVVKISSVSGGSLAIGLVFSHSNLSWPSSEDFKKTILPRIATILTTKSLQKSVIQEIFKLPWSKSRGLKFATALEKTWGINGTMKDLSKTPEWLINATSINTGKNWRFSQKHLGDWVFGHNFDQAVDLSTALTASAAIPYLVGKIKLPISPDGWHKIDPATDIPTQAIIPPSESVLLWDGGVYENLGIEAVWKPHRNFIDDFDILLIGDASARLATNFHKPPGVLNKKFPFVRVRPPRLFDITTDQIRSLRSRMAMQAIKEDKLKASIIRLGYTVQKINNDAQKEFPNKPERPVNYENYLTESTVSDIANMETHANKLSAEEFNKLLRHGFETTDATLIGHQGDFFPNSTQFNFFGI